MLSTEDVSNILEKNLQLTNCNSLDYDLIKADVILNDISKKILDELYDLDTVGHLYFTDTLKTNIKRYRILKHVIKLIKTSYTDNKDWMNLKILQQNLKNTIEQIVEN